MYGTVLLLLLLLQAANYMNNVKLAYDLHDLLLTGENINLVGDFQASGAETEIFIKLRF